jgi:hypothetical protein
MKKPPNKTSDDLRPEYDPRRLKGVRGKYYQRAIEGTNLALIEPDLAEVFPDSESVNRALRVIADAARGTKPSRARRRSRSERAS